MSILNFEHFDLYGTGTSGRDNLARKLGINLCTGSISAASQGRRQTNCMFLTSGNTGQQGIRWISSTSKSFMAQGVSMRIISAPTGSVASNMGISFGSDVSNGQLRICVNSSLGITVYHSPNVGNNTGAVTLGSTPNGLLTVDSYFWIEAQLVVGNPGSVSLRINGGTIYSFPVTSVQMSQILSAGLGKVGAATTGSAFGEVRFDDWIVYDSEGDVFNDWVGDTFIDAIPLTDDGEISEWVPSSGTTRWPLVDETTPDLSDFITANSVGDVQELKPDVTNFQTGAITAVGVQVLALKTDAGSSSIEIGITSEGVTDMGPSTPLGTGGSILTHLVELNPSGDIPWTESTFNASRLRVRRTS